MIHSIINYIEEMGFFMMLAVPFIAWLRYANYKKHDLRMNWFHEAGVMLFWIFLIGLLSQTILPDTKVEGGMWRFNTEGYKAVNLHLFAVIENTYRAIIYLHYWQPFFINIVGNIVLFIPIGFLPALVWKRFSRFFASVGLGFLLSLSIEIIQLGLIRSSDVDDIWLNTLGAFIGYLLYRKLSEKYQMRFKKLT